MKRTISVMVGKGSVNHNSRKFHASNTDPQRSDLNKCYCNIDIKELYHQMFDDSLKLYNEKQTRRDRRIENYYKKICSSEQEKPFHEVILQIGNKDTMSAESENGLLSQKILDEYYGGFEKRNPYLKVFSAHLHMDEATPHLHIDFVPFTTDSKRGLETRVSLKQALLNQGFKGGTRSETEWNQWVQSEKEQLSSVMQRHGIEWAHKGTHEKHLSVLDFEKQERTKEVTALGEKIDSKKSEAVEIDLKIKNLMKCEDAIVEISNSFETDPKYQLPEPQGLMSAKSYKIKFVEPLIMKLKSLVKSVLIRYFDALDDYNRLNQYNGRLYQDNKHLENNNEKLSAENKQLKEENKGYKLLRKVFGNKQIDELLEKARATQPSNKRSTRFRNTENER